MMAWETFRIRLCIAQIRTHFQDSPETFYLVRWQPPYRFVMAGVSDHPYLDCKERDPKGDEHPALFPGQN